MLRRDGDGRGGAEKEKDGRGDDYAIQLGTLRVCLVASSAAPSRKKDSSFLATTE